MLITIPTLHDEAVAIDSNPQRISVSYVTDRCSTLSSYQKEDGTYSDKRLEEPRITKQDIEDYIYKEYPEDLYPHRRASLLKLLDQLSFGSNYFNHRGMPSDLEKLVIEMKLKLSGTSDYGKYNHKVKYYNDTSLTFILEIVGKGGDHYSSYIEKQDKLYEFSTENGHTISVNQQTENPDEYAKTLLKKYMELFNAPTQQLL